jgi:hypothetical protein
MTDVVPRSLFINDVITEIDPSAMTTAWGGFGRVLRGKYAGQLVALKVLDKVRHQEVRQNIQLPNTKVLILLQRVRSEKISA